MTDIVDIRHVREAIATLQNRIAQERAFTVERVERLRRFATGARLKKREREEWEHFAMRTGPMQQELDVITNALADYYGSRNPPPVVIAAPACGEHTP
jgi:hypothetical protein